MRQYSGRNGGGEGAESPYILTHRQMEVVGCTGHILSIHKTSKPIPTSCNKAIPNPAKPNLLILSLSMRLWESITLKLSYQGSKAFRCESKLVQTL